VSYKSAEVFFAKGRVVALIGCLLFLSGCQLLTHCTYEERSITASGAVIENGAELASADIIVGALRGSLLWKSLDLTIQGTSLKGHVSSITLVRSDDPAAVQLAIPLDQPSSPLISSGSLIQRSGDISPDLSGLYEMIAANLGALEITTDILAYAHVSIPLTVTSKRDWFRPNNCY
jgi:hypothetical protein